MVVEIEPRLTTLLDHLAGPGEGHKLLERLLHSDKSPQQIANSIAASSAFEVAYKTARTLNATPEAQHEPDPTFIGLPNLPADMPFEAQFRTYFRSLLGKRAEGFAAIFDALLKSPWPPLIIETGCLRIPRNWEGDGQSSFLFDALARERHGLFFSIDINPENIATARRACSSATNLILNDSVAALHALSRALPGQASLLYLNSYDVDAADPMPSAIHHALELMAARSLIGPGTIVGVDDYGFGPEGGKAIRYDLEMSTSVIRVSRVSAALLIVVGLTGARHVLAREGVPPQVLAFYYSWYANPSTSGYWSGWGTVDTADHHISNTTDYPIQGAYDSHNPATVEQHAKWAKAAGITGFIADWWGQGTPQDKTLPLLLSTFASEGLSTTLVYEQIAGADRTTRMQNAISDLEYILDQYSNYSSWLRVDGTPLVFVYATAVSELAPADWQTVIAKVRHDKPSGILLMARMSSPALASVFDGDYYYSITGATQGKTAAQIQEWAHQAYPGMVAAVGSGKISSVTVIPGYDDRPLDRPPPRPVTARWNGATYKALWQEAVAAAPNFILITTWNEWMEGSELEPSFQYGSTILNETAAFSEKFLVGGN